MNTAIALRVASGLVLSAFGVLGLGPATERPPSERPAFSHEVASRAAAARTVEGAGGLQLVTHSPWIEERGIAHDSAEVRIVFDRELDPTSVNPRTVELGWIDLAGSFRPVPSDLRLSGRGDEISIRPVEPLWPAIYYQVRVRGGLDGVSAFHGPSLAEDYRWRFATQVSFDERATPPRRLYRCDFPPSTLAATLTGSLMVNVYQSVCNPALLPGKHTVIRAYAPWYAIGQVAAAEQLPFFDATVRFSASGSDIGSVNQRFYRPDTPNYKRLAESADNTANLFTTFPAGTRHSTIEAELRPTDGSTLRFSPGSAAVDWREWKTDREHLSYHVYEFDYLGSGPPIAQPWADITRTVEDLVLLTEQAFPVQSADWWYWGKVTIGTASAPSRRLSPVPGEAFPNWDWLNSSGTVVKVWERAIQEIADILAREAGSLVGSDKDVVIGIIPASLMTAAAGANALAATVPVTGGKVILTPASAPQAVLHETGHRFGLLHCPFPAGATYNFGNVRALPCDVEGFRIDPGGASGSNKSRTEGNTESPWLSALMFYKDGQRDEFTDADRPGYNPNRVEDVWPSMDSYRSLMLEFATIPGPPPAPEPNSSPRFAGASGPSATPPESALPGAWAEGQESGGSRLENPVSSRAERRSTARLTRDTAEPVGTTAVVRGFVNPDGSEAWITTVEVRSDAPTNDPEGELEPVQGLRVVARGRDGSVIGEQPVRVPPFEPIDSLWAEGDPRHFQVILPASDVLGGVAVLGASGNVLDERTRSANPPTVRLVDPGAGDALDGGDRIRWEGSDLDGDPVSYEVQARSSADGRWVGLGSTMEQSMDLEGARMPVGPGMEIRVIARDGFDRAEATVGSVALERAPIAVALFTDSEPGLPIDRPISVAFDAPMGPDGLDTAFQLDGPDGSQIPLTVSLTPNGRQADLVPAEPLRPGAVYSLRLRSNLRDVHGNELEDDYDWSFRTRPDELPPLVRESIPAPGALTVDPTIAIRIAMSEALDPSSLDNTTVRVEQGGAAVEGEVRWVDQVQSIVFVPAAPLQRNTVVSVSVAGVRDPAGNALEAPYTFEFTTAGRVVPVEPPPGGGR